MAFERNAMLYPAALNPGYQPSKIDLGEHIGRALFFARNNPSRLATLERLYANLTPEAKARADFARSWNTLEGNTQ